MKEKAIIIAAIVAGAWLGNRIRMPSGYLAGGMIAGLIAKGFVTAGLPTAPWLSAISQILVAYVVVANSDVETIKRNPGIIPIALGFIAVLVLFCLGASLLIHKVFGLDLKTAIYATAPGGLSGMALTAADAGAETPISMMFHLFRLIVILITTPLLASVLAR